jgi:hypothetical protein
MKKNQTNAMVALGITAIITVVILSVVFTFLSDNALNIQTLIGEDVTVASGSATLANTDVRGITEFGNATVAGVIGTTVNFTGGNPTLTISDVVFADGTYSANYTYAPSGYLSSNTNRTIIGILPVLLAITIFLFAAGFVMSKR